MRWELVIASCAETVPAVPLSNRGVKESQQSITIRLQTACTTAAGGSSLESYVAGSGYRPAALGGDTLNEATVVPCLRARRSYRGTGCSNIRRPGAGHGCNATGSGVSAG